MRNSIDGKRHDTEEAELICVLSSPKEPWLSHATGLYRSRRGSWFLVGCGMGGSLWGRKLDGGDEYVKGEGLLHLSNEEARALLEAEGRTEAIINYFDAREA